jgi:hypothetical protein
MSKSRVPSDKNETFMKLQDQIVILHHDSKYETIRNCDSMPSLRTMLTGMSFESIVNHHDHLAWKPLGKAGDVCVQKISNQEHNNLQSLVCEGYVEHLLGPSGSLLPRVYAHFSTSPSSHYMLIRAAGSLVQEDRFADVLLVEENDLQSSVQMPKSLGLSMTVEPKEKLKIIFAQDAKW